MVIYDTIAYRELILFVLNIYGIIRKIGQLQERRIS